MTRRCRICDRKLRSPRWRAVGLGPVCARRLGLVMTRPSAPVPAPSTRHSEPGEGQLALFEEVEG